MEWKVPLEEAGQKLISFLSHRLGESYSARSIKRAIEKNGCRINGKIERFASTLIRVGDHIFLDIEQAATAASFHFDSSHILYEDEDLFIYNKPAGVNSDPLGVVKLLQPYRPALFLIHRLDRDTTGVLLLAKKASVVKLMIDQFRELAIHKRYLAIVDGRLAKDHGTIRNYLGKKHSYTGQAIWGAVAAEKGQYAETEWHLIKQGKEAALIECFPKTGRTHQLRVHLAEMGHPILGDFHYSRAFHCSYKVPRYLLHASDIAFHHPKSQKLLKVHAPLPEDFVRTQKALLGLVDLGGK